MSEEGIVSRRQAELLLLRVLPHLRIVVTTQGDLQLRLRRAPAGTSVAACAAVHRPRLSPEGVPKPPAQPLSRTEIRVLRYLPTHLSGPEIARELSVSVTTVRTHTRHIFAKLGVHRRTEAVIRARALGLLAPAARAA
jgi:ATP/maltotriose-dependent transcriptional regulator MalT